MQTTRLESGRELVISRQKDSERQRETERGYVPRYPTAIINLVLNSKALYEIV